MKPLPNDAIQILQSTQLRLQKMSITPPRKKTDFISATRTVLLMGTRATKLPDPSEKLNLKRGCDELAECLRVFRAEYPTLKAVESRCRAAVRLVGFPLRDGYGRQAPSQAWNELFSQYPDAPGEALSLASFCGSMDPLDVDQAAVDAYLDHLCTERSEQSARKSLRRAVRFLNTCRRTKKLLAMPGVLPRGILSSQIPETIVADVEAWVSYHRNPDPEDDLRPGSEATCNTERYVLLLAASHHLRAKKKCPTRLADLLDTRCIKAIASSVGRTAAQLVEQQDEDEDEDDDETAFEVEADEHDGPNGGLRYQIARLICNVARSHFLPTIGCAAASEECVLDLIEAAQEFTPDKQNICASLTNKLRPYTEWENVETLMMLPQRVLSRVRTKSTIAWHDKCELTVAFALQLLMNFPEKTSRVASLRLDQLVRGCASDGTEYVEIRWDPQVRFSDARLEGEDVVLFSAYIELVRDRNPSLQANPYLFPGRTRTSKSPAWFRRQIVELTGKHLPHPLNVIELRWVLALVALAQDPTARDLAAGYLGHSKRLSLKPLLNLFEQWRRSNAFIGYRKIVSKR